MSRPHDDGNVAGRFQDDGPRSHATFCGKHAAKKTSPVCWYKPGLLFGRFRLKGEPDNRTAALRIAGSLTSLVTTSNTIRGWRSLKPRNPEIQNTFHRLAVPKTFAWVLQAFAGNPRRGQKAPENKRGRSKPTSKREGAPHRLPTSQ